MLKRALVVLILLRGECIDRGAAYSVDRTSCICGDTFEGENCGDSESCALLARCDDNRFGAVATDLLIAIAKKNLISSVSSISLNVFLPSRAFHSRRSLSRPQALLCSFIVAFMCI